MRNRGKYGRRRATQEQKNKILIVCGGETEEEYFIQFKHKFKSDLKDISLEIIGNNKKGDPTAVVRSALEKRDSYSETWAVFDKDDFTDFDWAIKLAKDNNINCAFSNEAFEYWFLLHYEYRTGAMSRRVLESELIKKLGFDYGKDKKTIGKVCGNIWSKLHIAEERAQRCYESHVKDTGNKPSNWWSCTTVFLLTKRLLKWSKI